MSPTEVESARPVAVVGWQIADRLFGANVDPLDKTIQIEGVHFRIVGVSAKRGSLLGQSQDEFAVIPLGQFRMIFGSRRSLSLSVKPRDVAQIAPAIDEATIALRAARRLKPKQADNFGIFTSDTILDIYHSATNGIFAVLVGVVGAVAGGRRHRHHEHHADGRHRADAGDRAAQGARRPALGHHGADADRVGGAVDLRRRPRDDVRDRDRDDDLGVHADPGGDRDLVGRCSGSASRRWSACSSACIRRCARRGWIRSRRCGGNETFRSREAVRRAVSLRIQQSANV